MSGGWIESSMGLLSEDINAVESIINKTNVYFLFSDDTISKLKECLYTIKQAQIHLRRIDYLVSGDDSEESFITRLNEDLQKLKQEIDDKLF